MADEKSGTSSGKTEADAPASPRRHPSRIARLFERNDVEIVRQAHISYYGFDINDRWATDLAKFVDKPGKLPQMFNSGDPGQVREEIKSIYGVDVSVEYAADLLAFAKQVTKGAESE